MVNNPYNLTYIVIDFRENSVNLRVEWNAPQIGPGGPFSNVTNFRIELAPVTLRTPGSKLLSEFNSSYEDDSLEYNIAYNLSVKAVLNMGVSDPVTVSFFYG